MKRIILGFIILVFIILSVIVGSYAATKIDHEKLNREHIEWVKKCLQDFNSIKPGITRGEIEKKFRHDGGLIASPFSVRFTHPSCPYFKIDVRFVSKSNTDDQSWKWEKEDKVDSVSKPYIERPFYD